MRGTRATGLANARPDGALTNLKIGFQILSGKSNKRALVTPLTIQKAL